MTPILAGCILPGWRAQAAAKATVEALHRHLAPLEDLRFSGRSGMFRYSWLHEMLRFGKDIIAETVKGRGEKLRGGA